MIGQFPSLLLDFRGQKAAGWVFHGVGWVQKTQTPALHRHSDHISLIWTLLQFSRNPLLWLLNMFSSWRMAGCHLKGAHSYCWDNLEVDISNLSHPKIDSWSLQKLLHLQKESISCNPWISLSKDVVCLCFFNTHQRDSYPKLSY